MRLWQGHPGEDALKEEARRARRKAGAERCQGAKPPKREDSGVRVGLGRRFLTGGQAAHEEAQEWGGRAGPGRPGAQARAGGAGRRRSGSPGRPLGRAVRVVKADWERGVGGVPAGSELGG